MRLCDLADVRGVAGLPGYDPSRFGAGILHLGPGAFHRAHQAVYTDAALAAGGGDWRIVGASLRSTVVADALNPQNGLYTLITRSAEGTDARVIASINRIIAATRTPGDLIDALADPAIRIVSLTVTEKAYSIDRRTGGIDPMHPAAAADLADPHRPTGVVGLLCEGLRRRRAAGTAPFTVLCCDNLPTNGALLRQVVADFAERTERDLARWIADAVAFPATMVDRITPAPTAATEDDALRLTGCYDLAAVETEPFSQWVIEDRFPAGRPAWEAGGALFVEDVAPYETMKLRMLNGSHSMLAYAGFVCGKTHVRDVMADAGLARLVRRHLDAASATLAPLGGIDFADYAAELIGRFANPAIAHKTYQIAMDGTEKMPQRIFAPALETLVAGQTADAFAFAVAAWMRYCLGRREDGEPYALRDPRADEIARRLASGPGGADAVCEALHTLPGLFPQGLVHHRQWRTRVATVLGRMLEKGVRGAIGEETEWPAGP